MEGSSYFRKRSPEYIHVPVPEGADKQAVAVNIPDAKQSEPTVRIHADTAPINSDVIIPVGEANAIDDQGNPVYERFYGPEAELDADSVHDIATRPLRRSRGSERLLVDTTPDGHYTGEVATDDTIEMQSVTQADIDAYNERNNTATPLPRTKRRIPFISTFRDWIRRAA